MATLYSWFQHVQSFYIDVVGINRNLLENMIIQVGNFTSLLSLRYLDFYMDLAKKNAYSKNAYSIFGTCMCADSVDIYRIGIH